MKAILVLVLFSLSGCIRDPKPTPLDWTYWPPRYKIEMFLGKHISALDTAGYQVMVTDKPRYQKDGFSQYLAVWPYKDIPTNRYLGWWILCDRDTITEIHLRWY